MSTLPGFEIRLYGGRALVGFGVDGEYLAGWPEVVYEAIRAINHLTSHGPIPARTVHRILGEVKGVGHLLPQALSQITHGLSRSLEALDAYDLRRDFADSVVDATLLPDRALRKATELGELLEAAQAAISEQDHCSPAVDAPDAAPRASHSESDLR